MAMMQHSIKNHWFVFVVILLAHVFVERVDGHPLNVANEISPGSHAVKGCALDEIPNGARLASPAKQHYAVGDAITYECSPRQMAIYDSGYVVYPSPNRTCLSTGSWSSTPPICAGIEENKNDQGVLVVDYDVLDSSIAETEHYVTVGKLDPALGSPSGTNAKGEYETFLRKHYAVSQAVYLGSIAITPPSSDACYIESVQAKVSPGARLSSMSPESARFSKTYHGSVHSSQWRLLNLTDSYAIQPLNVFTCQVVVEIKLRVLREGSSSGVRCNIRDDDIKLFKIFGMPVDDGTSTNDGVAKRFVCPQDSPVTSGDTVNTLESSNTTNQHMLSQIVALLIVLTVLASAILITAIVACLRTFKCQWSYRKAPNQSDSA